MNDQNSCAIRVSKRAGSGSHMSGLIWYIFKCCGLHVDLKFHACDHVGLSAQSHYSLRLKKLFSFDMSGLFIT